MKFDHFAKQIRNYAVASFLIPLIAINSCFLIYKFLGNKDITTYPDINWNKQEQTYAWNEYKQLFLKRKFSTQDIELRTFTNCPKYKILHLFLIFG